MIINDYLSKVDPARKELMSSIHQIILDTCKRIKPEISGMMGKEMIQYKIGGEFMYALSSVKTHMSLHMMPMYYSTALHTKYEKLFNNAKFGKACINFTKAEQMPLDIVKALMKDCAKAEDGVIKAYEARKK